MKDEKTGGETVKETAKRIAKESVLAGRTDNVVWLEGTAPEQHNPEPVYISGTITAPSMFLDKRVGEFYDKTAHALVSKTEGRIELIINEHTVCEKYTVIGQVEKGKKFVELGINTDKNYRPLELAKKLRLRRSIFKSVAEHASLINVLSNVEAKIDKEVNESKDDRANFNANYSQAVISNIPKSFTLRLPIIEGEEPVEIEVAVLLEVESGRNIVCYLESVDGADLIESAFEKLVEGEVEKIKDAVTVIYR